MTLASYKAFGLQSNTTVDNELKASKADTTTIHGIFFGDFRVKSVDMSSL
jgi:hypothetical protein